jgi:hypothetical protein
MKTVTNAQTQPVLHYFNGTTVADLHSTLQARVDSTPQTHSNRAPIPLRLSLRFRCIDPVHEPPVFRQER